MKWTKVSEYGVGYLGEGYKCGDYRIAETFNSAELQKQFGGRRKDYYWSLTKNGEVIRYASTAKALKQYAETL